MAIYDVTMLINETMSVYKNKETKRPQFSVASSVDHGDTSNETVLSFNLHTGTHVDFPLHVDSLGYSSRGFDISTFVRPVKVFDLTKVKDKISVTDLTSLDIKKGDFILFKTQNSFEESFNFKFIYLSSDAAEYLADKHIAGVGIDALGIERDQVGLPTHHTLMKNNIWIIEGLRLKAVPQGDYKMIALPLKVDNVDALPLTILLETI